ncbi:MAG: cysteine hydrolase family protein [Candidatus Thermoplasmatota archaeon]
MAATLASRKPVPLNLPPDTVLLTIDVQKGFDQFPQRNNPRLEGNVAALHVAWRDAGRPLIHVRHDSREPESVFRPGQPGNDFKPEAAPANGEAVVRKSVHSAFIGTDLEGRLRAAGANTLVILGIQTNFCVASTARMAGNLGYKTFVVGDACATFGQKLLDGKTVAAQMVHDLALAELHGEFATVVSTQDVLASLIGAPLKQGTH